MMVEVVLCRLIMVKWHISLILKRMAISINSSHRTQLMKSSSIRLRHMQAL